MKWLIFLFTFPYLAAHTLEEKVGQLLMVHFHGESANEEAKCLIQEIGVGGIIYYNWCNGLTSPDQVRNLSAGLQNLGSTALLIAIDHEGGRINHLKHGFTSFPSNRALAESGNPELAERNAFIMGQELKAVGINLNLAPVVDINCNPRNPIIGDRSYGDDPDTVLAFASKALDGFKRTGIIAALKHFPGHGDVEVDSHLDLPVLSKSLHELEQMELIPFAKLDSAAVMTAHLLVPAFDKDHCSTLSKKTLDYLREKIGFQGVIISDSLIMQGVLKMCTSVDDAAIDALNAGCDILLLGGKQPELELRIDDIKRIHLSLVSAVKEGRVPEARLQDAYDRVMKVKTFL